MDYSIYYFNTIKILNDLENDIFNYENEIKALQEIKRLKKKDGTDFKNLRQNFNDKLYYDFSLGFCKNIYVYYEYRNYDLKYNEYKISNNIKHTIYLKNDIEITLDIIENAIKNEIETLKNYINNNKRSIEMIKNNELEIFKELEKVKYLYKNLDDKNDEAKKNIYYKLYKYLGYGG